MRRGQDVNCNIWEARFGSNEDDQNSLKTERVVCCIHFKAHLREIDLTGLNFE